MLQYICPGLFRMRAPILPDVAALFVMSNLLYAWWSQLVPREVQASAVGAWSYTGVAPQQGQLAGYPLTNLSRATLAALGRVSGHMRTADLHRGAAMAAGGRPTVDD